MFLGFCGVPGAGKTSASLWLESSVGPRWSFASALRDNVGELYRLTNEELNNNKDKLLPSFGRTARSILIEHGNNCRLIWPNVWIAALDLMIHDGDACTIDDVRWRNEAEYIKARGGYVVRIDRIGYSPNHTLLDSPTEREAALIQADFTIKAKDLKELHTQLDKLVSGLKALEDLSGTEGGTPRDCGPYWERVYTGLGSNAGGGPPSRGAGHEADAEVRPLAPSEPRGTAKGSPASKPVLRRGRRANGTGGDAPDPTSRPKSNRTGGRPKKQLRGVQGAGKDTPVAPKPGGDRQVVLRRSAHERWKLAQVGKGPKADLELYPSGDPERRSCGPTDISLSDAKMGYGGHKIIEDYKSGTIYCEKGGGQGCHHRWDGRPSDGIPRELPADDMPERN